MSSKGGSFFPKAKVAREKTKTKARKEEIEIKNNKLEEKGTAQGRLDVFIDALRKNVTDGKPVTAEDINSLSEKIQELEDVQFTPSHLEVTRGESRKKLKEYVKVYLEHLEEKHTPDTLLNSELDIKSNSRGYIFAGAGGRKYNVIFGGTPEEAQKEAIRLASDKVNRGTAFYFKDEQGRVKKALWDDGFGWFVANTPKVKITNTTDLRDININDLKKAYTPTDRSKSNYNTGIPAYSQIEHKNPFVNTHGVLIDPKVSHILQGEPGMIYAYGGSYEERLEIAQKYLLKLKHEGAMVFVQSNETTLYGGANRPFVNGVDYLNGRIQVITNVPGSVPKEMIGAIDPDRFTKQLDVSESKVPTSKVVGRSTASSSVEKAHANQKTLKEKVVPAPDKSPVSNINHKYDVIKTNSLQGKFEYSKDGKSISSFSLKGPPNQNIGKTMLVNNYVEILNQKNISMQEQQSLFGRATNLSRHIEALSALGKDGAKTLQADFIRKSIKRIIDNDTKLFGPIFKGDIIENIK